MSTSSTDTEGTEVLDPGTSGEMLTRVRAEIGRVIVGQQRVVERVLVSLLAGGHCLLEGAPGLGKTRLLVTLATTLGGSFNRIQFTPDLLPSDIVGTRIWRQEEGRFSVELGPVFANFVLTDEINRAPAKVQSALLEVMAEKQVTIGGETFKVDLPFLVLATQNPIESEGVYQLPEAQRDRFLMKVPVDYPAGPHEELEIVRRAAGDAALPRQIISLQEVQRLQTTTRAIHVDPRVADYAVRLVMATRDPVRYGLDSLANLIAFGASPRASIGLVEGARALALLRGRGSVEPQDIYDIGYDVLNHRLVMSFDAVADGVSVDEVLYHLLTTIPAPTVAGQGGLSYAGGPGQGRPPSLAQGYGGQTYGQPRIPSGGGQSGQPGQGGQPGPTGQHGGQAPTSSDGRPVAGPAVPGGPNAGLQAASPYGVSAVSGEFQGQRDIGRGTGRSPGVEGTGSDGAGDHVPVPPELRVNDTESTDELDTVEDEGSAPAQALAAADHTSGEEETGPTDDSRTAIGTDGPGPLSPPS